MVNKVFVAIFTFIHVCGRHTIKICNVYNNYFLTCTAYLEIKTASAGLPDLFIDSRSGVVV